MLVDFPVMTVDNLADRQGAEWGQVCGMRPAIGENPANRPQMRYEQRADAQRHDDDGENEL